MMVAKELTILLELRLACAAITRVSRHLIYELEQT